VCSEEVEVLTGRRNNATRRDRPMISQQEGGDMRARWWALSIVGILLAAAICTLVLARCRPYPWCKTTECIEDGTYCFDPVVECPTDPGKEALTEWTR